MRTLACTLGPCFGQAGGSAIRRAERQLVPELDDFETGGRMIAPSGAISAEL
jgi:hypothetical protein